MAKPSATYRHVTGVEELTGALRALSEAMRAEILGEGVKGAIKPILVAAKRFAKRSEDTGALRESLTTKVVVYKQNGKAVGLVGPDRHYYKKGKRVKGKLGKLFTDRRPANYAHLVEYGHHAVKPRKGTTRRRKTAATVSFVPAKPFIRPAVMTTTSEQAAGFAEGIRKHYARTVRRLARTAAA